MVTTDIKGQFPLRKISIGPKLDWTFFHLVLSTLPDQNKLKILQLYISSWLQITGSHWNRKFGPKICAYVLFCSNPVRSHAYFPEWKSAFRHRLLGENMQFCRGILIGLISAPLCLKQHKKVSFSQALKYQSVKDIVCPIHKIVRREGKGIGK